MNWEAISAVSEIVGAVAVVISLIYVAAQIRQNTKMMRTAAKQNLRGVGKTDDRSRSIYTRRRCEDVATGSRDPERL